MAEQTKLEFFKEALEKEGLDSEQWGKWLDNASVTVFAVSQTIEKFEPYAVNTISPLKEIEEELLTFKQGLEEGE